MSHTNRRRFLGSLAFGAGAIATRHALAAGDDGHAAGYDVAADSRFTPLIPRRGGEAPAFTYALDRETPKAVSGGWARDVTMRTLPIAEDIAGAHLFVNPGGAREMHWHRGAEWACVLAGHCQVTVGVSGNWGDEDGSDMTGRAVAGWGIADGLGVTAGRNGD